VTGARPAPALVTGGVVLLVLLAYLPSLRGGFFSDDFFYVVGNQTLQSLPLTRLWEPFVGRTNPIEFLPIRDLSYRIDMALFGLEPVGYHLHNLLLYALCCVATWLCCRATLRLLGVAGRPGAWMSAVVTILFAVHPAHVETVAWISGRKELLSGLFALLALWQFAKGILPERPDWKRLPLSYGLFLLALMSKSTALPVVAVAAMMAAVRYRSRTAIGRAALALAPMALLAVVWLWLAVSVGSETMVRADPFNAEILRRSGTVQLASRILGYLARIAVAPVRLRLVYDVAQPGIFTTLAPVVGGLTLLAGAVGAVAAWRRSSLAGFGAASFVALCAPFLQLVPFRTWSLASERFLFLPVFALALAAAGLLHRAGSRWRWAVGTALAAVGLAITFGQSLKWGAREPLIEDAARLAPGSRDAQMLLVNKVLLPAGRYDDALEALAGLRDVVSRDVLSRYVRARRAIDAGEEGLAHREADGLEFFVDASSRPELILLVAALAESRGDEFEAARRYHQAERTSRTQQDLDRARASLARVRSRYADRLAAMRRELAAKPNDLVLEGNLANLEMELFLLDEAAARFRNILRRQPDHPVARYNLGLTYSRQGRYGRAAAEIERAIAGGFATATTWNNLGIAYKKSGRLEPAEAAFRQALRLDANHCHAAINLGYLRMALGRTEQARSAFEEARDHRCGARVEELIDLYVRSLETDR